MVECKECGAERKLYHPCPKCGKPTYQPRTES